MLWWKIALAYCLLEGLVIWFAYRMRMLWPEEDTDDNTQSRQNTL